MGTLWSLFLCLVIASVLCFDVATCCKGASPKLGNMTEDYDLEVGSTLTARCTLFSNLVNITGLEYYVTSKNLMIKFGNRFFHNLEIVDDFTVEYTKENATIEDTGLYSCFLSIPEIETNPFVCTMFVAVGYPPIPVEHFSCISQNYERLNCSWDKPFNPVRTTYTLYDYLYGMRSLTRRCPIIGNNSCEYRVDSKPPYLKSSKVLSLLLVGENSLGKNTQQMRIDHFKIVKPSQPKLMMFQNITTNSAVLVWHPPRGMEYNDFPPGLDYWIYYCPLYENCTELCGVINVKNHTSTLVSGLVPFMNYKFMLRCRSSSADSENMWSPFLNSSMQTDSDVPYLAPEVTTSSFQVQNIQHKRTITLYWKPVSACFQNDGNFQYVIQYHHHFVHSRIKRSNKETVVGNVTSYAFPQMDVNFAYMFRIYATNDFGIAENSSIIIVDKSDKLLHGPTDISVLSHGEGEYAVSWKASNGPSIKNYTLYWCASIRPRPFECEGALNWITVIGTYQELRLTDTKTNYQFAVAANSDYSTSGLKWASCIVPFHGVLYKVNDVLLTPVSSTSIRVNWLLDCNAQKNVVKEYAIFYCPVYPNLTCSDIIHTQNVSDGHAEQFAITDLVPFTTYQFTVAARTEDGWSENSWVKYELTKSAAPTDAPWDVKLHSINGTVIKISFRPPKIPNGEINRYVVVYESVVPKSSARYTVEIPFEKTDDVIKAELNDYNMDLYTNYSIQVQAYVKLFPSPISKPIYALTGIGAPNTLSQPNAVIINETFVNISWFPSNMPNGPIDMYQLTAAWRDYVDDYELTETDIRQEVFNVTGQTYLMVSVDCPSELKDGLTYLFSVQAVNMKDNYPLYSMPSEPTTAKMCLKNGNGMPYTLLVGIIIGVTVGLTFMIFLVYSLAKWMKKKVDFVKSITVQLPTGLDSPLENPLNTYNSFKDGLQKKDGDSGIASENGRLVSYAPDKLTRDIVNSFDVSSEFLNSKRTREKSGRNQSGDSNVSGKCHDSISSTATNKTHLSIDSGAEMDLPPSPDGMFSDTSSTNTTPRSYKPDLEIVEESNPCGSKDSGLEKEGINSICPVINPSKLVDPSARFPYYIRKKGHSYFNGHSFKRNEHIQPYSKFAIVAPVFTTNYVAAGVNNVQLLQQQSLANSEPSVSEFQDDSDSEPLMVPGLPPYCRFGLARSAGNGLNITNQSLQVQENLGYSKFGIIYSAIGKPPAGGNQCPPNYSRVTCAKVIPHFNNNLSLFGRPLMCGKRALTAVEEKPSPNSTIQESLEDDFVDSSLISKPSLIAQPVKHGASSGYVSFNQALSEPTTAPKSPPAAVAENCPIPNDLSIITAAAAAEVSRVEDDKNRSVTLQPRIVAQPKSNGYVTFQDAKALTQQPEINGIPTTEADPIADCAFSIPGALAQSLDDNGGQPPVIKNDNFILDVFHLPLPNDEPEEKLLPLIPDNGYLSQIQSNPDSTLFPELSELLIGELDPLDDDSDCRCRLSEDESDCCPQTDQSAPVQIVGKPNSVSNGYVAWNDILGSKTVDVATLPNGTNGYNVEHV